MKALSGFARLADMDVLTETVKVLVCPLLRVSEVGITVQVAPVGAPEQARATTPARPGDPVSDKL